jgi:hypothetical protein
VRGGVCVKLAGAMQPIPPLPRSGGEGRLLSPLPSVPGDSYNPRRGRRRWKNRGIAPTPAIERTCDVPLALAPRLARCVHYPLMTRLTTRKRRSEIAVRDESPSPGRLGGFPHPRRGPGTVARRTSPPSRPSTVPGLPGAAGPAFASSRHTPFQYPRLRPPWAARSPAGGPSFFPRPRPFAAVRIIAIITPLATEGAGRSRRDGGRGAWRLRRDGKGGGTNG